jgi:hypothetical protein
MLSARIGLCGAALATCLLTTTAAAQGDQTTPLPDAAAAQLNPSTLPDAPVPADVVPPDVVPEAVPPSSDESGPLAQPGAEGVPDLSGLEGALEGVEEEAAGRQRPSPEAMGVARSVSGLIGCLVCSPLGAMGGMLIGMTSYAIWLATQGHASAFDPIGVGGLPFFGFAGSSIGGALAGPFGALTLSAAVDLAQPKLWPIVVGAGVTLLLAAAPVGGGIAMYEVGVNMQTSTAGQRETAFRLMALAPVVAAAGILTGAIGGLLAYDAGYMLLGE